MAELTKEQQAAIDNYSNDIKTLKDFVTAVRKLPGMYIGSTGIKGLNNMFREIFQNSVDQILDPSSTANWVNVYINSQTLEFKIEDNGKGLPFDDIIRILTTNHTSKNFEKEVGNFSSGLHGSGSKICNSLSDVFIVESYRYDGTAVRLEFHKGYPTTKAPVKIPNKEKKQGLSTYFIPDLDIMGEATIDWKVLYNLVKIIMSLTPIGSICNFEAIDLSGNSHKETIINKEGIITDLIMKVNKPINKPILINANDGYHKLDLAFCYDAGDDNSGPDPRESITSFANFCPTLGGTHVDGVLEGIIRWYTQYMNNIYLVNQKAKNKIKVNSADIKTGLNCMISAAHLTPVMTGQSKELLSNEDMVGFCKDTVMKGLDEWSKSNPQDLAKLAKFFKDMAELRMKDEAGRSKIVQKYHSNAVNDLPSKYVRPLGAKCTNFYIVEGDSALGTVKVARNPQIDGILPIRGKIINAFAHSKREVFENAEVQAITKIILGTDYTRNFTIDDVKVERIIVLSDGDDDGAHIAALILRLFVMYFPQIVEAGMLYKALPPLFSIKEGKKTRFFTERIDIIKYIQADFLSKHSLANITKSNLSNREITKFFLMNSDYTYFINKVSNTYAVEPYLLEMTLYNYIENNNSINVKKLEKSVKSNYRFMNVSNKGGYTIISGSINESNLIICHDKFFNDCKDVLDILHKNDSLIYLLDKKPSTLYQIMTTYEASTPSSVQRYKGLGEISAENLKISTLDPNGNRTLIRYTMEDAKEATKIIREYETDTKKILQEVHRVSRDDLIE